MGKKQPPDATPADVVKRLMKDGRLKRKCCRSKPRCRKCPVLALQRAKDTALVTDSAVVLLDAARPGKSPGKKSDGGLVAEQRGTHLRAAPGKKDKATKKGKKGKRPAFGGQPVGLGRRVKQAA